jgi:hypothetical protein
MSQPIKDLSKEELATLFEMLDYLCSKIDFSKTFLDNTAIISMNVLFRELRKDERKFNIE